MKKLLKTNSNRVFEQKYKTYRVGSRLRLAPETLDNVIALFSANEEEPAPSALEGRRAVKFTDIRELGRVAVKYYTRGGLIRTVNRQTYLNLGEKRSKREFAFLLTAEKCGAAVPEPLVYASRGTFFYRAWLITKEIAARENFMQICRHNKPRAVSLLPAICDNITRLINSGIYHVDLHPGNILIDDENKNHIVDFDRARLFSGSKETLARRYMNRWKKAAEKYNLPTSLARLNLTEPA